MPEDPRVGGESRHLRNGTTRGIRESQGKHSPKRNKKGKVTIQKKAVLKKETCP